MVSSFGPWRDTLLAGVVPSVAAWQRRHPLVTRCALVVLAALFAWAGYEGYRYYRSRAHFNAARQAVDRHEWAAARDHLTASLHGWPNRAATHLLAARVARRLERLDEADEQLQECQRLEGGETHAIQVERALVRVHRGDLAGVE